ncbi:MAG TPA: hypothetical protein VHY79_11515 [Rhizomicrobium sp.]|jgi:hypothetical protein|nr:hypothetical protein [Rhizomicrobium sp.]
MATANAISKGLNAAAREHLIAGNPLTRLEALILFGVSNLPELVYEMKRQNFKFEKRDVPYATAMVRINKYALLKPPPNLPIREILLTEYWVKK